MMLLNVNSPQMQQTLREHVLLAAVRTIVLTLILISCIGVIGAAVGFQQLKGRSEAVQQEAAQSTLLLSTKTQGSIAETTQLLNSQVKVLMDIQKRFVFLTPLIQHIATITPSTVTLREINCSIKSGTCSVSGTAATRDSYTAYEKVLEDSDYFSEVVFPLVTKKTAIDFSVTMKATFTF